MAIRKIVHWYQSNDQWIKLQREELLRILNTRDRLRINVLIDEKPDEWKLERITAWRSKFQSGHWYKRKCTLNQIKEAADI